LTKGLQTNGTSTRPKMGQTGASAVNFGGRLNNVRHDCCFAR
jgi:hypothetical protein